MKGRKEEWERLQEGQSKGRDEVENRIVGEGVMESGRY